MIQHRKRYKGRGAPDADEAEEGEDRFEDGTVTRVVQQRRDPERVSVFIDDAFAFGLALDLAVEAGLKRGLVLSADAQRTLVAREHQRKARAAALDYLSYQARSTAEVRKRLKLKGYDEATVEDAVTYVATYGYLDDAAYAVAYVKSRFAGRAYGPERLRQELLRKGVARDAVEAALESLDEGEQLEDAALTHARTRWAALAAESDARKRQQKTLAYLVRRGYAYDQARAAVEQAAAESPPLDDPGEWDE